ncbi:MAG: methyl-accepting chemotaxis protein [Spirochaetes bacterium]|nr:methyl-accepting chemotaxis protein [Spirochaetota bacterium]
MSFKNLRITTKLTISVAAFLLPLGILFYSIISTSYAAIIKDRRELNGIEVLRPAISLMQIIPQYVRFSVDLAPGDLEFAKQYTSELLSELNEKYTKYFGDETVVVSMKSLSENWEHLENTRIKETILWAYKIIMEDIYRLIVYVGDISGLVTDSELESAYLIAAAVHELPQAQDRLVTIVNLLRTIEAGAFTQKRKDEFKLNVELLRYSDNLRIQNRFDKIKTMNFRNTESLETFELLLKACYDRMEYFAQSVEFIFENSENSIQFIPALYETSSHANNAAFRLQSASLDRLNMLISERINRYMWHFIRSLASALLAIILAFSFIIVTVRYIHISTQTIGKVFQKLDENDLTSRIEVMTRDEMGELMEALGAFLDKLNTAFSSFTQNAYMVSSAVFDLSSSAREITTTANKQSASVAEIVSTMENNKNISSETAKKTEEVAFIAAQTQELSLKGASLRDANENMMLEIKLQNAKIIENIRNLADILSSINETVHLINVIADKTKLIAFNAALEASSSGEAGSRFSVVAGEIRRFADNVVDSVSEIKEKITELQDASHILITEANNGSRTIDEGYNRMVEQKKVFENIVDASENVAVHSRQIYDISKQQELASAHIFTALKEISGGVSQFVSATSMASSAIDKLNNMSIELKETLSKYKTTIKENI